MLEDAPAIARLLVQLTGREHPAEAVATALARGDEQALVAEHRRRVVGVAALQVHRMLHHDRPTARLTVLVVDERHRGQGIGARLLSHILERARRAGCSGVELTSGTAREAAHRFYERQGFTATSLKFWRAADDPPSPCDPGLPPRRV